MKTEVTNTVHATVHFPIIHPPVTVDDQRKKVLEELDEFMDELHCWTSVDDMVAEMNDVYQAFVTLIYMVEMKKWGNRFEATAGSVELIEDANSDHRAKIERYKVERGWK